MIPTNQHLMQRRMVRLVLTLALMGLLWFTQATQNAALLLSLVIGYAVTLLLAEWLLRLQLDDE